MAYERKCILAPDYHHYKYCPNCEAYNNEPIWKVKFCSLNCKNIYEVLFDFTTNKISAIEAQKRLNSLDLSDKEHFHPVMQNDIKNIYSVSDIDTSKIETETVEKPKIKYRKKHKRNIVNDVIINEEIEG